MAHNDINEARQTYDGMIRWSKIGMVIAVIVVAFVLWLIT